jgi:hypothetical protein
MYLLDTNILLEILLTQQRADESDRLIETVSEELLFFSEFSLYSLGVKLVKMKRQDTFDKVVNDMIVRGGMQIIRLEIEDMTTVIRTASKFNLDFDDAYQYVAAEKYNLTLVSFDADFDRTERGRQTPAQVLADQ